MKRLSFQTNLPIRFYLLRCVIKYTKQQSVDATTTYWHANNHSQQATSESKFTIILSLLTPNIYEMLLLDTDADTCTDLLQHKSFSLV